MTTYRTLREPFRYEPPPIKNSRFLACVAPAPDEAAARAFVEAVREEFADARHVCFAWSVAPGGNRTRSSDDGEPSGSAGRPILAQIEGHELDHVAVCVVRWFGGVKLGVGGLMRAYGGAAGQALDRAEIVEIEVRVRVTCTHPYDQSSPIQALLAAEGLTAEAAEYADEVRFEVQVPEGRLEAFRSAFVDATRGRGRID